MQEPQLHNDQKQEEAQRASGNEEILQYVPQADGAQRSEIVFALEQRGKGRKRLRVGAESKSWS
jgi:hypothetical protein